MMNVLRRKKSQVIATFVLALCIGIASAIPTFVGNVPEAQATAGFPMYSWGHIDLIGRPVTAEFPNNVPARIGSADNWVSAATSAAGSFAVNNQGHLYGWGNTWTSNVMGQGANPSPGTGHIAVPTRIGTADDWVQVESRGMEGNAVARNSQGHIYAWGFRANNLRPGANNVPMRVGPENQNWVHIAPGSGEFIAAINSEGQLFTATANTATLPSIIVEIQTVLGRPGGSLHEMLQVGYGLPGLEDYYWVDAQHGGTSTFAINSDGYLYSWGRGLRGQLGHGDTNDQPIPKRVQNEDGTYNTWKTVRASVMGTAAISTEGHLYTWGDYAFGQLGRENVTEYQLRPHRVGDCNQWVAIFGGQRHVLAINAGNELYAWGQNSQGELGIGDTGAPVMTPTRVAVVEGFSTAASGGGQASIMLFRILPELFLTKRLQMPEGTTIPNATFAFQFEGVQVQLNNDPVIYSRPVADVPDITPNPTITIDPSTATTAGGITTVTGSLNIMAILNGLDFPSGGLYVWNVSEVAGSSNTAPPSHMAYSNAIYQLRVLVDRDGEVESVWFVPMPLIPCSPKMDEITFVNSYFRANEFEVEKNVAGISLEADVLFDFEVSLTPPAVLAAPFTTNAYILNADGTTRQTLSITLNPGATTTLPSAPPPAQVRLGDGEIFRIPALPVGTNFSVTEAARAGFAPSVSVIVGGDEVYTNYEEVNTALSTADGGHLIAQTGRNAAVFTNTAELTPPTGLIIRGASLVPFVTAAIGLMAFGARKYRRSIDEIPILHDLHR